MCGAGLHAIRATHINEDDAERAITPRWLFQIVFVWVVVEARPNQKIITGKLRRKIGQWNSVCNCAPCGAIQRDVRSEEHTSELQSRLHLVCRLLLEKKKNTT